MEEDYRLTRSSLMLPISSRTMFAFGYSPKTARIIPHTAANCKQKNKSALNKRAIASHPRLIYRAEASRVRHRRENEHPLRLTLRTSVEMNRFISPAEKLRL